MQNAILYAGSEVVQLVEPIKKTSTKYLFIKGFTIMKLIVLLTIVACVQANANGYAQTINLSLKEVTLEKVFKEIEKQSGYHFIYTKEQIASAKPISIDIKNSGIIAVLDICFKEQPIVYSLQDPYIIIRKKESEEETQGQAVRERTIRGRVTNEEGQSLIGATVQLKGSDIATACNEKGEWILTFEGNYSSVVISSVGYAAQEILIEDKSYLTVQLKQLFNKLDETIVIAYGKTTQRLNTGSVAKVTSEVISQQPVSNVLGALQGRVPGLEISSSSGIPGSSFNVQIRGRNSIVQGSQPLFIIDGVPFAPGNGFVNQLPSAIGNPETTPANANGLSPFNFINSADIESIEVLKDADATSIYGSRGANGVIIITTKKGKPGQTRVTGNFYRGNRKVTRMMDFLNTSQYVQMRKEAFANDNITPTTTNAPDILVWDTSRYTDFKSMLIGGTAHTTDAQASLSGGNINTQFLLATGYHHETTVFPGEMFAERGSVNFNLKHGSDNKRFNANLSFNYISGNNQLSTNDLTSSINLSPNSPELYDSAGNLNWQEGGVSFNNPLSYLFTEYAAKTENLVSHLQLSYTIINGLDIKVSGGYNSVTTREERIVPIAAQNPASNPIGESWFANRFLKSWIIEPQTEYATRISKGRLILLLGGTFQKLENEGNSVQASGFSTDALIRSVGDATTIKAGNSYKQYKYAALFGRINYNWKNKYILSMTGRRDGSSRFGPANQFANFGSIGGAWIFSEERFIKKSIGFLSFGKLRVSYGSTGNDQISDYQYLDTWSGTSNPYQGVAGLVPTRLFNPNHRWEVNRKFEGAIELGFLKDKIFLSTAYFKNRSDNQLVEYQLPLQTGFSSIMKNFDALVQNTGWEMSLNTINISRKKFKWSSNANITFASNKLVSFPGIENSSYANTYEVGKSLNVIKKYKFSGVDAITGVYIFEDVNKDGSFNASNDFQVLGDTDADFYGGLGNSISYRGWQLDVFIEFRKQTGRNYLRNISGSAMPGRNINQPVIVLDRWQQPGDITDIQKFSANAGTTANTAATRLASSNGYFSDASFIRLKNLSISYSLPSALIKKIDLTSARFFLLVQNFLTITNYKGADPETQNFYVLPPLRTIALGFQLSL